MTLEGTIRDGLIVPDAGPRLPDGARVRYELLADDEDDIGPPPTAETREEFLQSLRDSVAEARAGVPGIPLAEAMSRIAREFDLPWPPTE
jgi:hypothetical protein